MYTLSPANGRRTILLSHTRSEIYRETVIYNCQIFFKEKTPLRHAVLSPALWDILTVKDAFAIHLHGFHDKIKVIIFRSDFMELCALCHVEFKSQK